MRKVVIEQLVALATAAFGLVAALAWNGAIQSIFKKIFGTPDSLAAMIIYAVIVTIIAVIVTIQLGKVAGKAK
jgi:uncharacterized membrane protein